MYQKEQIQKLRVLDLNQMNVKDIDLKLYAKDQEMKNERKNN